MHKILKILLLIGVLDAGSSQAFAQNLIKDSSFEAGGASVLAGDDIKISSDGGYHADRYAISSTSRIYFQPLYLRSLPKEYTISLYMRAPIKPGRVKLAIFGNDWNPVFGDVVSLTKEWRRVSFTIALDKNEDNDRLGPGGTYVLGILNLDRTVLNIDALQWEEGELTSYTHQSEILAGLETSMHANVYGYDTPLMVTANVSNFRNDAEFLVSKVSVFDFFGRSWEFVNELELQKKSSAEIALDLSNIGSGHFELIHTIENVNGQELASTKASIAKLINRQQDGEIDLPDKARFGIGLKGVFHEDIEVRRKRWERIEEANVNWVRVFVSWAKVEHRQGMFDWSSYDEQLREAYSRNKKILVVFYNREPKWLKSKGDTLELFDLKQGFEKRLAFIEQAVQRYRDRVDAWEVFNEPYNFYKAATDKNQFIHHYTAFHKQVYTLAKRHDPDAQVVGNFSRFGQNADHFQFLKKLSETNAMQELDVVSMHIYEGIAWNNQEARYENSFRYLGSFFSDNEFSMPAIWHTEGGISSDDRFDTKRSLSGEYRLHMKNNAFGYTSESHASSIYIKGLLGKIAQGVDKDFYFKVGDGNGPYTSLFTMFRDRWREPKKIYSAYQVLTELLSRAEYESNYKFDENTPYYLFDNGKEWLLVGWDATKSVFNPASSGIDVEAYDFMGNRLSLRKQAAGQEEGEAVLKWPHYLYIDKTEIPDASDVRSALFLK